MSKKITNYSKQIEFNKKNGDFFFKKKTILLKLIKLKLKKYEISILSK